MRQGSDGLPTWLSNLPKWRPRNWQSQCPGQWGHDLAGETATAGRLVAWFVEKTPKGKVTSFLSKKGEMAQHTPCWRSTVLPSPGLMLRCRGERGELTACSVRPGIRAGRGQNCCQGRVTSPNLNVRVNLVQ